MAEFARRKQATELCARRAHARIVGGMDRNESIRRAVQEPPYPPEAVIAYHVKVMEKKRAARLRARRADRIFAMMREGKSNAAIARDLGVSPSTVAKTLSKGEPK
ncbi:helix-turn-helix domain-containing protein [Paramagnetospirillum magneticum]|nr:helix-turn-helix domain-containing protein [Paramagnetospirillum magneticum]